MQTIVDLVLVDHQIEWPVRGFDLLRGDARNRALIGQAVANQIGDGADLQTMFLGEFMQFRRPLHGAVIVDDLANHATRPLTGQAH